MHNGGGAVDYRGWPIVNNLQGQLPRARTANTYEIGPAQWKRNNVRQDSSKSDVRLC